MYLTNSSLNLLLLICFYIVTEIPAYCNRSPKFRMHELPMRPFAPAFDFHKSGRF